MKNKGNKDLLKEAIADAKAVKETALANAKIALEEAFTPRLQSMLSHKIAEELEDEEVPMGEEEEFATTDEYMGEEDEMGGSEEPSAEVPSEEPAVEPEPEAEVNEYDSMDALESFINTPIEAEEINLSNYSDLGKIKEEDELKELDLDEIKNDINQAIGERLSKYFS